MPKPIRRAPRKLKLKNNAGTPQPITLAKMAKTE
jgi:hypothetical protein